MLKETAQPEVPSGPRQAIVPRSDFPLTERVVYLNSAGMGLIPAPVLHKHETFTKQLAELGSLAYFENAAAVKQAPREAGARLFGAPIDCIAIVASVSEAISQLAWWLRPSAGQNVVSIDIDAPAVTYPWIRVAEETGAEIRLVKAIDDPGSLSFEQIASLVDDNTAAICVSHVQWFTGYRFDLSKLAALAHAHGALLVVDAMQSAGVVPIDVVSADVDVLVTGSYKWLCGFAGVGACYVREQLAEQIRPILVGFNTAPDITSDKDSNSRSIKLPRAALRLEYCSSAHGARFAFTHAIDYMLDIGIHRILEHVQALNRRLAEGAALMGGVPLTPLDENQCAGILNIRFPGRDPGELAAALQKRGVIVMQRCGGLRFAPHMFNNGADIELVLCAIEEAMNER